MISVRIVPALIASTALLAGCGDASEDPPARAQGDGRGPQTFLEPPPPDPGFEEPDPDIELAPESSASVDAFLRRAGDRHDFRVPRSILAGLKPGPLARGAIERIWAEVDPPDAGYRRLNVGQRALYVLQYADFEILNGGFYQYWTNSSGYMAADLVAAARRVGAPEYEALFRDAAALFPNGEVPRGRDEREQLADQVLTDAALTGLDERYAEFQYHRKTALGLILGRYVRAHLEEFVAD